MKLRELLDEGLFRTEPKKKVKPITRVSSPASSSYVIDNRTDAELERDILRAKKLKAQGQSVTDRGSDRSSIQDWTF